MTRSRSRGRPPLPPGRPAPRTYTLAELARVFCATEAEIVRQMARVTGGAADRGAGPFTEEQVQQLLLVRGI